ncbi:hypothetical protein [Rhodococcus artemisiae]|uniref:Uncharacterized protein n=1 Tax=Rhodococcus artemisiae TaxID=714159 RepID=A0ABU7LL75_9NOCA|nr:hypothetical protein [Rhodococcus artemisiae]MEE2062327.1 hypothetical protein [Rhodococcus artemisiae]
MTTAREATPLLTLHPGRLDRISHHYLNDGPAQAGYLLLQEAVDQGVITWDRAVWGRPLFGAGIKGDQFVVSYNVSGELWLSRAAKVDIPDPDTVPLDEEDVDWIEPLPSLPDPTHQRAEFLRLVVDEINDLHIAATRMVATWPGVTGTPALP